MRRNGFTLIELLIVMAIIAILMAILLPTLAGAKERSKQMLEHAQMQSLVNACEAYQKTFQANPGYYSDQTIWDNHEDITSSENLLISLLGGATSVDDAQHPFAHPEKVGTGAAVEDSFGNVRVRDVFYSPKPEELAAATGTLGDDNEIPEFIGLYSGMPLLYYRARGGADMPVTSAPDLPFQYDTSNFDSGKVPESVQNGAFFRRINADFTEATELTTPVAGPIDQANQSLISDTFYENVVGVSSSDLDIAVRYGNLHLSSWVAHQGMSVVSHHCTNGLFKPHNKTNGSPPFGYLTSARGALSGGYTIMSAGKDGVYFNHSQAGDEGETRDANYRLYFNSTEDPGDTTNVNWGLLENFDDKVLVGGKTPD